MANKEFKVKHGLLVEGGKVGIGDDSPDAMLKVVSNSASLIGSWVRGDQYGLRVSGGSTSSHYALRVANSSDTTLATFNGDGKVGIGTASPAYALDVSGPGGTMSRIASSGTSTYLAIGNTSNTGYIGLNGSALEFYYSGTKAGQWDANGIKFFSDTAAASGLNDYEEGDWQPTNADSGETANMAANSARYTKIGNFVSLRFDINNNSGNHAHLIGGLPFPVKSGAHGTIQISYNNLSSGTSGYTTGYCNAGTSYIRLTVDGGTDAWQLNNGYRIIGFGAYETDN